MHTTYGIVHAGFSGFRAFVARKKSRCKLIGNRLVLPHDTIPSNVRRHFLRLNFFDTFLKIAYL
jgi:hypothetical protein